ncbi:type VI secretion system baseplate subunit TssE [Pseudovibrio ascidiaceicola]|jgi:type VI secretion system protein|uniref:Type VI secretion system protein n=1 Tax=Pseudovibrio ascidiaceicola TaxID=285279 RepID=A0A1I4DR86_9HYPH|nr:type VI secretion system baseplate subunit TssE [Pseudovibrio ascidiaceicola]SFK96188.1 type VI secretion system protein [Pseudovibrio ascidiaceicola]
MRKRDEPVVWDSRLRTARGSLFERLIADEEEISPPQNIDLLEAKVNSIKRHLAKLLNARAGASAATPDLGLVDFNLSSVATNDLTQHIAASIRQCIEKYEPRVQVRSVHFLRDPDRPLELRFKATLLMPALSQGEQVQIDILMKDGHVAHIV